MIKCINCDGPAVKNGVQSNGVQRFYCKQCRKSFQENYTHQAYKLNVNERIISYLKEGLGIRSIARLLAISTNTLLRRIKMIADKISKPKLLFNKEYEVDEMCTYVNCKEQRRWIVYAIEKDTRKVVDFSVGRRTNKTIGAVLKTLFRAQPKLIFTDKLRNYRYLIEPKLHSTKLRGTNYIERMNLTIRTHLKRLNRRTICFSRTVAMLVSCLAIYFWS